MAHGCRPPRWRSLGLLGLFVSLGCASHGITLPASDATGESQDSLAIVDGLTPADVPDGAVDAMSADTPYRGVEPDARWLTGSAVATYGPRTELSAVLDLGENLSVGFRVRDSDPLGFAVVTPPRWIRRVVVGNMVLRMGERIVLGRGFVDYPFHTTRGRAEGVVVSPSLSRWSGRPGLAIDLGGERLAIQSVFVSETPTRLEPSPGALWLSVASRAAGVECSAALGRRVDGNAVAEAPLVTSLCARYPGDGFVASAEWATVSRRRYFAVTLSSRGAFAWFARVYRVPAFPATAMPSSDLSSNGNVQQGASIVSSARLLRTKTRFAILLGSRITGTERRMFRRLMLTAGGRTGIVSWEGSVTAVGTDRISLPKTPDVQAVVADGDRALRGRVKLQIASGPHVSYSLAIDHRIGAGWRGDGLVLIVAGRAHWKRFETRWQTAAYSLGPGQGALITRPGVGSFESFSSVYGGGSDNAIRIRVRLSPDLLLTAYLGEPWQKQQRLYVGASATLR